MTTDKFFFKKFLEEGENDKGGKMTKEGNDREYYGSSKSSRTNVRTPERIINSSISGRKSTKGNNKKYRKLQFIKR